MAVRHVAMGVAVGAGVAVALYLLLGAAMDDTAALARELQTEGESVHARVAARMVREERDRRGGRPHTEYHHVLILEGVLASGAPWSAEAEVDPGTYEATPDGSALDVVVLSAHPERFMFADELGGRDASGHEPGEGVMAGGASAGAGAIVALVTTLVAWRRGRS